MADLVQFVEAPVLPATVLLDLNDHSSWWVKKFSAPPPRLRRSMAANAMRDGVNVGSSTYGERVLTLDLECIQSTQDAAAEQMQTLWRLLDRESGWLLYQPQGASAPVFFSLHRSDASQLEDVAAQAAMRNFTIELLADSHALGLRETLGPYSIANDPEATDGCAVEVTDVKGDVATPVVLTQEPEADYGRMWLSTGVTQEFVYVMADGTGLTLGDDTALAGSEIETTLAGADAMSERVSWSLPTTMARGAYRAMAWVETTAAASVQAWAPGAGGTQTEVAAESDIVAAGGVTQLVDLGVFYAGDPTDVNLGYLVATPNLDVDLSFRASSPGAATITWLAFALIPAGERSAVVNYTGAAGMSLDGVLEKTLTYSSMGGPSLAGGFPRLAPGETNHLTVVCGKVASDHVAARMSEVVDITIDYWPRYLFVRPSSS